MKKILLLLVGLLSLAPTFAQSDGEEDFIPTKKEKNKKQGENFFKSLALLSGLRIQHCHKLHHRRQMQLRSGVALAVA